MQQTDKPAVIRVPRRRRLLYPLPPPPDGEIPNLGIQGIGWFDLFERMKPRIFPRQEMRSSLFTGKGECRITKDLFLHMTAIGFMKSLPGLEWDHQVLPKIMASFLIVLLRAPCHSSRKLHHRNSIPILFLSIPSEPRRPRLRGSPDSRGWRPKFP